MRPTTSTPGARIYGVEVELRRYEIAVLFGRPIVAYRWAAGRRKGGASAQGRAATAPPDPAAVSALIAHAGMTPFHYLVGLGAIAPESTGVVVVKSQGGFSCTRVAEDCVIMFPCLSPDPVAGDLC
ncbi:unnamed protein product, partial [Iphiclides podalirius]